MQKVDLLFLAHNRLEFTRASWKSVRENTDWSLVNQVIGYDDDSTDGTRDFLREISGGKFVSGVFGGPVAVMNHAIAGLGPKSILAKIDNDVMVPPKWLNESLAVMDRNPDLDLLGIEALYPVGSGERKAEPAQYIGGIGLMRTRVFTSFPEPQGRFGFTAWQDKHPEVKKSWLNPSLPVCLLDRVPFEPWSSWSAEYIEKGWQRPWAPYDEQFKALWEWWT